MKLRSTKFRIALLAFGTILSLCACLQTMPPIIGQTVFVAQVLVPGALPPEERYLHYISLTNWSLGEGWHRLGGYCADLALQNRPASNPSGLEESFVYTLIGLTKYEEAKMLLSKLPPLSFSDRSSALLATRRRALMTQACMGLHQYELVAEITNDAKMDFTDTWIFESALAQNSFVANLCTNNTESALRALDRVRVCRLKERVLFGASDESLTIVGQFVPLLPLSAHDYKLANQICNQHLQFWTKIGSDPDAIPMLEAASPCMSNRGYLDEAHRLADAAKRLRATYHSGII